MRLRLHHQLALPFAAVAVVGALAATWFAVGEVGRWVEGHRAGDVTNAAAVLGRAQYASNSALLRIAADLAGVEAVAYSASGQVLASSFPTTVPDDVRALIGRASATQPATCGQGCVFLDAPVTDATNVRLLVVSGRGGTDPIAETASRTIAVAALLGVVLLIATSQLLARVVTSRIERLVDVTNEVGPGSGRRAPQGSDDIGRLGAAFNRMWDRQEEHRLALMRAEKLAVAGLMAARVAHDVRNPLSSVKMQAQLLSKQHRDNADVMEGVQAILRDVGQLEAVVSDLLETARPEAPTLQRHKLPAIVRASVEPLRVQLAHRRILIDVECDDSAPPVMLDPSRLQRALTNLLTNAAEASRGGDRISVITSVAGGRHLIAVLDEGVGIDPALLDHIFDPFVSGKPEGTGLGLVNARAIIESHGGTITVTPRTPRGTSVVVELPLPVDSEVGLG